MNIRKRFECDLSGGNFERPVFAVYDWFVKNRPTVDWEMLFSLGLGQINHANLVRHEHPNFELVNTDSEQAGQIRRDVCMITDKGELHEWYLGEWRQEHFIKTPEDYRIMARALEGVRVIADEKPFLSSELKLGDRGITVGQIAGLGSGRTPLMVLQIDWVGLEQFSIDLAYEMPELFELLELMYEIKLEEIRQAVKTPASQIKLWENLSVETIGPFHYRRHLLPLYKQILEIMGKTGKRLQVHYDGRLKIISEDIAGLDFDGIDSLTEAPEGDMTVCDARKLWPDKFLWQNINLNWYEMSPVKLKDSLFRSVEAASHKRHCLMISEEVPQNWRQSVPLVLEILEQIK
ncbi:MAG: hypothetical protein WC657_06490 [Candidatus Paceibacterota bacterium]